MLKKIVPMILILFLIGCTSEITPEVIEEPTAAPIEAAPPAEEETPETITEKETPEIVTNWRDATLTNVKTGEDFKISDFKGKIVLLESFAVWCPTCRKQQDIIRSLHEEVGDSFVSISIDTDPNEEARHVISHIDLYGYEWPYAVSPVPLTRALIKEFGQGIAFAPGAPIVLICEDQSARLLASTRLKSADVLKEEMAKGC